MDKKGRVYDSGGRPVVKASLSLYAYYTVYTYILHSVYLSFIVSLPSSPSPFAH